MSFQDNDFKSKMEKEMKIEKSLLLLKQKMFKTDDLIKQYFEKDKENERMRFDLESAKKESKRLIWNYKSAMDKITELELKITQSKQSNEKLTYQMNEYDVNMTSNKQLTQQLTCKIEELEEEHSAKIMEYDLQKSSLEENIKVLKQELKKSELKLKKMQKKTDMNIPKHDIKTKSTSDVGVNVSYDVFNLRPIVETLDKSINTDDSISIDVRSTSNIGEKAEIKLTSDIGINVSLCELNLRSKFEVEDKNIMTDEFYNIANDPFPLFCAKCETHLSSDPLLPEKIYKTMACPKLIDGNLTSPRRKKSSELNLSSDTQPNSMNIEIVSSTEKLCASQKFSNLSNKNNDSIIVNQMTDSVKQKFENEDANVTPNMPNLSSNPIPLTINLSKNMNYTKENFHSDDLLIKEFSSIKQITKKLKSLENKMERFLKLKKKPHNYCCHHCAHNDTPNLNVLNTICKSLMQYYNEEEKKKVYSRNDQNELRRHKYSTIMREKRKRLKKLNAYKNSFWEISHVNNFSQNTLCHENAPKVINVSQFEHDVPHTIIPNTNENDSILDVMADRCNDNESDKVSILCMKENQESVSHPIVTISESDISVTSDLITNEISINNDSLFEDDAKYSNLDNQTATETLSLSNSQNIDYADSKIIALSSKTKRKSRKDITLHMHNRLLKKIKNLKKKTQVSMHMNKQKDSKSCSDYNFEHELVKSKIEEQKIDNHSLKSSNLKRKLEMPANLSINVEENIELYSDQSSTKKKRIAHIPKSCVFQSNTIQENCTHNTIRNIAMLERFQQHNENKQLDMQIQENDSIEKIHTVKKKDEKMIDNEIHNINNGFDDTNSKSNEDYFDDDNFSSNVDIEQASMIMELDKCNNVPIDEIHSNASAKKIIEKISNSHDESNAVSHDIVKKLRFEKSIINTVQFQFESSNFPCEDSKYTEDTENDEYNEESEDGEYNENAEDGEYNEDSEDGEYNENAEDGEYNEDDNDTQMKKIGIIEKAISIDELGHTSDMNAEKICEDSAIPKDTILNDDRLSLLNQSNVLKVSCHESDNNDHNVYKITSSSPKHLPISNKVIEDHIVETPKEKCTNQQEEATKCTSSHNNVNESQTVISWIIKYMKEKPVKYQVTNKQLEYITTITDRFVKKQLQRLADSVWEDSVHQEVLQNLTSVGGSRIIAKGIIEFLLENKNGNNNVDKSFTPPAPLMTTFEQKLTALLVDLKVSIPTIIHFVQAGIQYKLFKLNNDVKNINDVDTLTRMYVVLSRIQKDREKIRIMCCDALYCMDLKSISVLYIVLTCWPEVLPNAAINIGILPKCIALLIGWKQIYINSNIKNQISLSRLKSLKSLITAFYNYAYSQETINDFVKELTIALKVKQINALETATILIAKRKGPSWTQENIINSILLPMIINNEHPCIYSGFSLLGKLLRAFSSEDKIVKDITEQLCDLIESGQGSHDQQEGIISALLSLSRQNFNNIVPSILKWNINMPLRSSTKMQLEAFIRIHKKIVWKPYLKQNFIESV